MIQLSEIYPIIDIVLQAGKRVHEIFHSNFTVQMKKADDPLTNADIEANSIIVQGINKYFPDDGIFSEEIFDNSNRIQNNKVWIIDPIDGTREFVAKRNEFCISVGLSVNHIAEFGIILNPATKELFMGIVGQGVFYTIVGEEFSIQKSSIRFQQNLKKYSDKKELVVSRSEYESKLFSKNDFWEKDYTLKPIGSIAYKLALVATGIYSFTISLRPKNEWDICAGVALIEANGLIAIELTTKENFTFNRMDSKRYGILAGEKNEVFHLLNSHIEEIQEHSKIR
ncbi:MAG: 3'(2'),5'-bisphosphate nucleotidase CysQ [Leptospiraceae bacterium]|nr:3'(2'),5'-bisphosphate nucleotidase CysQ [Leptospiraceae bacterium]MCK6381728.1 3'(2'),5'-bisphosphate nucleotidase CysQ [Leptospiraceae bacterium]NUM42362.1 3'(2'),5'-bisphosphate nucleotidase CysQ [Leptospiraceae bacterium]